MLNSGVSEIGESETGELETGELETGELESLRTTLCEPLFRESYLKRVT